MEALIGFCIKNRTAVLIFVVMMVITGTQAWQTLPREAAPDLKIPVVMVTVPYPGVSPTDIETLVTREIETELKELKNVKVMRATCAEGASIISIEFEPSVDIDDAVRRVREKVDTARPDLPADILEPVVKEISFEDFPILTVNLSADYSLVRLKKVAEDLQDVLETIPGVLEVNLAGGLEREIQVVVDPERLVFQGVSIDDVVNTVRSENVNLPGGQVTAGRSSFLVRVPGDYKDPKDLEQLVIKSRKGADGIQVALRLIDVAHVVDTYKERETLSRINRADSISINISKRGGENLIAIADEVKRLVEEQQEVMPPGTRVAFLQDQSKFIRSMVSDLENNIASGLLLVLLVLPLFLTARSSLIVASAIPLSMLAGLAIIQLLGITLNMIVLFSLILSLGMLVDNSIVAVENTYRLMSEGETREGAALKGAAQVAWPIISSTATTVAAFAPLLFWPGIMGQFMGFLPRTIIICLTASLVVALLINPVMCVVFLKVNPRHAVHENTEPTGGVYRFYKRTLVWALDHRLITFVGVLGMLVVTVAGYGAMKLGVEFFPQSTPDNVIIEMRAADGSRLETSDRLIANVERFLDGENNLKNYVTSVGVGGGGRAGSGGGQARHLAQIFVDFKDVEERTESPYDTIDKIRTFLADVPGARFEIRKQNMGPPSGAPVGVEISGADWDELGRITTELSTEVATIPNLVDLKDDFNNGRPEVQVRVNREKARLVGTSTPQVAQAVRTAINGTKATTFHEGEDEYDVTVRFAEHNRHALEHLNLIYVTGKDGVQVPLTEVATVVTTAGAGSIRHKDRLRVITLSANTEGRLPDEVRKDVVALLEKKKLPAGYHWRLAGQNEEQDKAKAFLSRAFLIAALAVLLIIVLQFNSLLSPLIIMTSVLLSTVGALWGMMVFQKPFGVIMTGLGIISLAGVAVNNAIVLIDFIQVLRRQGLARREAVVRAGVTRLRPVLLTAITTVLGLSPMVFGVNVDFFKMAISTGGRSAEMWAPMAIAVAFGLTFTTFLTLVLVPVLYDGLDSFGTWFNRGVGRLLGTGEEPAATAALADATSHQESPAAVPRPH